MFGFLQILKVDGGFIKSDEREIVSILKQKMRLFLVLVKLPRDKMQNF
jgi:hypothetical protein